ncbi:sensor histidine kinase [Parvularcula sp. LCG005]|uniref:sensor histidine kinase n=1 Tax=Parvularcula sp. LCG005 TaxID=3078805 RepID=UPI002942AF36|nr:ATP-binding protein [Parvularcula sp. LCG005]WOI54709.1 ATP-binding protein [Parvularcula sp. LCG005]
MSRTHAAETAFENAANAIIVVDHLANIVAANRVARHHFGFPCPETTSKEHLTEFRHVLAEQLRNDKRINAMIQRACCSNRRLVYRPAEDINLRCPQAAYEFVRITPASEEPLVSIEIHPRQIALSRILEMKREVRRQQATACLQHKNATAMAEVNSMLNRFAFAAAHDIQEPVRIISILTDMLEEERDEMSPEELDRCLQQLGEQARRARGIVVDVLEFSRVRELKPDWHSTSLNAVVENALDHHRGQLDALSSELTVGDLGTIEADPKLLTMLIQNLVSNAIKYRRGDKVELTIDTVYTDLSVELRVADKGLGFEQKYASMIFEIFKRLHRKDEISGTGIGLALCKTVVDTHRGEIWATGTPGEGACFHIRLPIRQASPAAMDQPSIQTLRSVAA